MKVVVTDYIEPDLKWEEEQFAKLQIDFYPFQLKHASAEKLIDMLKDADIIIVNMAKITSKVIDGLKKCKLIIRHGAGYDNIDISATKKNNILVSYIPDYCINEVAEQSVMLLLCTYRKFTKQLQSMDASLDKEEWDFSSVVPLKRIYGKTAGLIGCGRIGAKVLNVLRSLGTKVLVSDPNLTDEIKKELGVRSSSLEEVFKNSDMITIHSALDQNTYHLIGEKELKLMKREAIIVNTARGGIIDVNALAKACKENWIAGAAIDVYEKEPPTHDFPLIGLDNVLLTPHLGWYSEDAEFDIRKKIVEDIIRFSKGEIPRYTL